jgi:SAM-dependent MidA family methyltransferase
MTDWLASLLGRFEAVHACLIDYAAPSDELATRPPGSVVRAFRRHRSTDVVIDDPGATDLTVEVNIDAVAQTASRLGYEVTVGTQRNLLLELGVADRRRGLVEAEHEAARTGRTMDQLRARSERLDLEALLDPSGLGGFTVFRIGPRTAASPVMP